MDAEKQDVEARISLHLNEYGAIMPGDLLDTLEDAIELITKLRAENADMRTRCNTLAVMADPITPIEDFEPGPQVTIYWFDDAPQEWQDLSGNGGDEDYLVHVPAARHDSGIAYRLRDEDSLNRSIVNVIDLDNGDQIIIHCHA